MVVRYTPTFYPESDGKPMADNTEQFQWIVLIKENLEILFAQDPEVFIAGDLLWYPVEKNYICQAPDTLVVFGRPKGKRGSYQQWKEDNIPPQVVFEILSPNNTLKEMAKKFDFYQRYGVEEYYLYDPEKNDLSGWLRSVQGLEVIDEMNTWVSPRLGIRFSLTAETLEIYRPDGTKFLSSIALAQLKVAAELRAEQESLRADQEAQRADQEAQRADHAQHALELLRTRLRDLGLDP